MKSKTLVSECKICSSLKGGAYANFMEGGSLSPEAEAIASGLHSGMVHELRNCPECGRYYWQNNDVGFGEDDVELVRITPTQAGEDLSEEDLAELHQELLGQNDLDLEYASQCLSDHYSMHQQVQNLLDLFEHPKAKVRLTTVVRCLSTKENDSLLPLYKSRVENDPDAQVRLNAMRYFNYNLKAQAQSLHFFAQIVAEQKQGKSVIMDACSNLEYYAKNASSEAVETALKPYHLDLKKTAELYTKLLYEK